MNWWLWLELAVLMALLYLVVVDDFRWPILLIVVAALSVALGVIVVVEGSWVPAAPMLVFGFFVALYHVLRRNR